MADQDKEEYARLEGVIAALEKQLDVSPQRASPLLSAWLENCKKQLESMGRKIKEKEQEARVEQNLAIQAAVERETALNADEKQKYGSFLKEAFFTKADFGRLDSFYEKTYDKLTDSGQENMHHRLWEGVRRGEYDFADLPKNVQQKDAVRVHKQLLANETLTNNLAAIPEEDRSAFLTAFNEGERDEACKVLNRKSFRDNIALAGSTASSNQEIVPDRESAKIAIAEHSIKTANSTPVSKVEEDLMAKEKARIDIAGVDLSNLELAEADIAMKPDIAAKGPAVKTR